MTKPCHHLFKRLGDGFIVQNLACRQLCAGFKNILQHHARCLCALAVGVVFSLQQDADRLGKFREDFSIFNHFLFCIKVVACSFTGYRLDGAQAHTRHDCHQCVIALIVFTRCAHGVNREVCFLPSAAFECELDSFRPGVFADKNFCLRELTYILTEFFDLCAASVCLACGLGVEVIHGAFPY